MIQKISKAPVKAEGFLFFPIKGKTPSPFPDWVPEIVQQNWEEDFVSSWRFNNEYFFKTPAIEVDFAFRRNCKNWLGKALNFFKQRSVKSINLWMPQLQEDDLKTAILDFLEVPLYMEYDIGYFKTVKTNGSPVEFVNYVFNSYTQIQKFEKLVNDGKIINEAVNETRRLVDLPANMLSPEDLFNEAARLREHGVRVEKVSEEITSRMGGLNSVGAGSTNKPCLIEIELNPSDEQPILLIGKGVTFDSGGLCVKSRDSLPEEKTDMAGAAAVIGIIKSLATMGYDKRIVALIPAAENMPDGAAYRPGDIVKVYDGTTVEILNTDAEGRLILADAFCYAREFNPRMVIDLATLTGNIMQALSTRYTGLFCNDKELERRIMAVADDGGEQVWPMPLHPDFADEVKGRFADLRNSAISGREAGACTAAAFLNYFVRWPWAHLDIAGSAIEKKGRSYRPVGYASGVGVKLVVNAIRSFD
ncbi:MAG: leucyl aminopeptidase [Clostridiales bacterium]|jgi:leucyl aminopeptidase|nr:leucyl aminopeptidase [Clostridiales bacterium]MDN5281493.1 leucyl aminopeptidase [Candidatus Ozemobacter sp.]